MHHVLKSDHRIGSHLPMVLNGGATSWSRDNRGCKNIVLSSAFVRSMDCQTFVDFEDYANQYNCGKVERHCEQLCKSANYENLVRRSRTNATATAPMTAPGPGAGLELEDYASDTDKSGQPSS